MPRFPRNLIEPAWERLFGADIFITYTRRDGEPYARALQKALKERYLVFLDDTGIHGSQSISQRIEREVQRCRLHIIVLTPKAVDEIEAPWIHKEVDLHIQLRKKERRAIFTIYFPPNLPASLPATLKNLGDFKGAFELPGAELVGSPSIAVLEMIASRLSPAQYEAHWQSALAATHLAAPGIAPVGAPALPPYVAIRRAFSAVRQRTRMLQALAVTLLLLLAAFTGVFLTRQAAEQRASLTLEAEQAETHLRFQDAEQSWQKAKEVAPWGAAPYQDRRDRARRNRLLTPAARVTVPAGWSLVDIGQRGRDWSLLIHRLHDSDTRNGRAALLDPIGGIIQVSAEDDFNPRVLFRPEATYLHAAGRLYRIPVTQTAGSADPLATLQVPTYELASSDPQIELGWKDGKLCVLAGLERPPKVYLLDPVSLAVVVERTLTLPVDLARKDEEPDGTDRFGEALFRISTRPDTLVTAVWRRNTEHSVGIHSWAMDLSPRPHARKFPLPMNEIGQLSIPQLESLTLSPEDKQLFVQVAALNLFGNSLNRAGRDFWIALDTASARPPWLMDSQISALWPLPVHQHQEAYYLADGNDLRALTFQDFVVIPRPGVGILRDVRAGALLSNSGSAQPSLAVATEGEMLVVHRGAPVFRMIAPRPATDPALRLNRVYAAETGPWLAAAYEVHSETEPRHVLIWKVGAPDEDESASPEWPKAIEPGL